MNTHDARDTMLNFYADPKNSKYVRKRHSPCLEATGIDYGSRVLCCAASGGGKTSCLYTYLSLSPGCFAHVVICNRGVAEPIYDAMKDRLKDNITFHTLETLPKFDKLADSLRESDNDELLVVFDDLSAELSRRESPVVNQYFSIGRKKGMTIWFLSQSYTSCPIFVRLQCTHLMMGKASSSNDIKRVLSNYVLGVDLHQLEAMHRTATRKKLNFLKIDIEGSDLRKKFSHNFVDYFTVRGTVGDDSDSDDDA